MTDEDVTRLVSKASAEELKRIRHGLDLLELTLPMHEFAGDQMDLIVSLRDRAEWFRHIAALKIRKTELEEERERRHRDLY